MGYIMERLDEMRLKHNILLVTNDHVAALTKMADSTITVSAIDRSKVLLHGVQQDREMMLHAVAKGGEYMHSLGNQDLMFFMQTEVLTSPHVGGSMGFTVFAMILFLMSFWDSKAGQEALVLVGLQIVAFFAINPFLISLADWRNTVTEEADALMHASVQTMMHLKSVVTLILLIVINVVTFGCLIACMTEDNETVNNAGMWVSMLFDSASLTLPFICFGLYSRLPLQIVQILASLPFLFMIFFSTTFSPGSGVAGVKELRYLFARFYLWCRIGREENGMRTGVRESMDGCPDDDMLVLCTIASGCLGMVLFVVKRADASKTKAIKEEIAAKPAFATIQSELYKNLRDAHRPTARRLHGDRTGRDSPSLQVPPGLVYRLPSRDSPTYCTPLVCEYFR